MITRFTPRHMKQKAYAAINILGFAISMSACMLIVMYVRDESSYDRFFSKSELVEKLWSEILPDDLLVRPRSSRIFYRGKFFSYPLRATEALVKLGVVESALCVLSYFKALIWPCRSVRSFEDWVSNNFGERLFRIFCCEIVSFAGVSFYDVKLQTTVLKPFD